MEAVESRSVGHSYLWTKLPAAGSIPYTSVLHITGLANSVSSNASVKGQGLPCEAFCILLSHSVCLQ